MNMLSRTFFILAFLLVFSPIHLEAYEKDNDSSFDVMEEGTIEFSKSDNTEVNGLSTQERQWYYKFQNGLMLFDGWRKISRKILACLPSEKKAHTSSMLKNMGVKIGTEWSRDNAVRKISTDKLRDWGNMLKLAQSDSPETITNTIEKISQEVDDLLVQQDQ